MRDAAKRSSIGGDLNLPQADWNGNAKKSGFQVFAKKEVWDNGYNQVVTGLTRGDALLDSYLLTSDNSRTSCNIVTSIRDYRAVLLEVEWGEICRQSKMERIIPLYHKKDRSLMFTKLSSGNVYLMGWKW
jgi:hypothetical protein